MPTVTDQNLTAAVAAYLASEASAWDAALAACGSLASADAASDLEPGARAKLAAKVTVSHRTMAGETMVLRMSSAQYSKRVKVGRMAADIAPDDVVAKLGKDWADANRSADVKLTYRDVFELSCDEPSVNKFYDFLPKAEHLAKPKGTGRRAKPAAAKPAAVSAPETAPERVNLFRWDNDRIDTFIRNTVAAARAQGADTATMRAIAAAMVKATNAAPIVSARAA